MSSGFIFVNILVTLVWRGNNDAQFDIAVVWKCVILFVECILLDLTEKKRAHLCKINLAALNSS